jgi:hypothetical protein
VNALEVKKKFKSTGIEIDDAWEKNYFAERNFQWRWLKDEKQGKKMERHSIESGDQGLSLR